MSDSFELSTVLLASPARMYAAWLSSDEHAAMTGASAGGSAEIDPRVGGAHSAWGGYITGTTLELEPDRRIVQTWRTVEFPADSPDSRLEIVLEPAEGGTRLTLKHSNIPIGQGASYESGWVENYFDPMRDYFSEA
ncbi:MAG: SRPBCC domain-containing protein [Thermoflexales bacterium]|nr:SRPBCC domain-containing protein [Thermoflexales bacterium]